MGAAESSSLTAIDSIRDELLELEQKLSSIEHVHQQYESPIFGTYAITICEHEIALAPGVHITVGPIVGQLTDTSVRILLEVDADTTLSANAILLDDNAPDGRFASASSKQLMANRPAVIHLTDLLPSYAYHVYLGGVDREELKAHRITIRTPGPKFREPHIVALSGNRPDKLLPGETNMWSVVGDRVLSGGTATLPDVDLVIFLGNLIPLKPVYDQCWMLMASHLRKGEVASADWQHALNDATARIRSVYRQVLTDPTLRKIMASASVIFVAGVQEVPVPDEVSEIDYDILSALNRICRAAYHEYIRQLWDNDYEATRNVRLDVEAATLEVSQTRIATARNAEMLEEAKAAVRRLKKRATVDEGEVKRVEARVQYLKDVLGELDRREKAAARRLIVPNVSESCVQICGEMVFLCVDALWSRVELDGAIRDDESILHDSDARLLESLMDCDGSPGSLKLSVLVVCTSTPLFLGTAANTSKHLGFRRYQNTIQGRTADFQMLLETIMRWRSLQPYRTVLFLGGSVHCAVHSLITGTASRPFDGHQICVGPVADTPAPWPFRMHGFIKDAELSFQHDAPVVRKNYVEIAVHLPLSDDPPEIAHEIVSEVILGASILVGPVIGLVTAETATVLVEMSHEANVECIVRDQLSGIEFRQIRTLPRKRPFVFFFDTLEGNRSYSVLFDGVENANQRLGAFTTPPSREPLAHPAPVPTRPGTAHNDGGGGSGGGPHVPPQRQLAMPAQLDKNGRPISAPGASAVAPNPRMTLFFVSDNMPSLFWEGGRVDLQRSAAVGPSGVAARTLSAEGAAPAVDGGGNEDDDDDEADKAEAAAANDTNADLSYEFPLQHECDSVMVDLQSRSRGFFSEVTAVVHIGVQADLGLSLREAVALVAQAENVGYVTREGTRCLHAAAEAVRDAYRTHWNLANSRFLLSENSHIMMPCARQGNLVHCFQKESAAKVARDLSPEALRILRSFAESARADYERNLWVYDTTFDGMSEAVSSTLPATQFSRRLASTDPGTAEVNTAASCIPDDVARALQINGTPTNAEQAPPEWIRRVFGTTVGMFCIDSGERTRHGDNLERGDSMLTEAQWRAFSSLLDCPGLRVLIVVSDMPFVDDSTSDAFQKSLAASAGVRFGWPFHSRDSVRLLDMLFSWKLSGVDPVTGVHSRDVLLVATGAQFGFETWISQLHRPRPQQQSQQEATRVSTAGSATSSAVGERTQEEEEEEEVEVASGTIDGGRAGRGRGGEHGQDGQSEGKYAAQDPHSQSQQYAGADADAMFGETGHLPAESSLTHGSRNARAAPEPESMNPPGFFEGIRQVVFGPLCNSIRRRNFEKTGVVESRLSSDDSIVYTFKHKAFAYHSNALSVSVEDDSLAHRPPKVTFERVLPLQTDEEKAAAKARDKESRKALRQAGLRSMLRRSADAWPPWVNQLFQGLAAHVSTRMAPQSADSSGGAGSAPADITADNSSVSSTAASSTVVEANMLRQDLHLDSDEQLRAQLSVVDHVYQNPAVHEHLRGIFEELSEGRYGSTSDPLSVARSLTVPLRDFFLVAPAEFREVCPQPTTLVLQWVVKHFCKEAGLTGPDTKEQDVHPLSAMDANKFLDMMLTALRATVAVQHRLFMRAGTDSAAAAPVVEPTGPSAEEEQAQESLQDLLSAPL